VPSLSSTHSFDSHLSCGVLTEAVHGLAQSKKQKNYIYLSQITVHFAERYVLKFAGRRYGLEYGRHRLADWTPVRKEVYDNVGVAQDLCEKRPFVREILTATIAIRPTIASNSSKLAILMMGET